MRASALPSATGAHHLREAIVSHVEAHLGVVTGSFGDLVPGDPAADVLVVPPADERPWQTLVSCGMAARPMPAPALLPDARYAEVMLRLPAEWPLAAEAVEDRRAYWPVGLVKWLARAPHQEGRWLWAGHTVAAAEPPPPLGPGTALAAVVLRPVHAPRGFGTLQDDERTVRLLAAVAIYADELELARAWGSGRLLGLLDEHDPEGILDPGRDSVAGEHRPPDGLGDDPSPREAARHRAGAEGLLEPGEDLVIHRIVAADDLDAAHEAQALMHHAQLDPDDGPNGAFVTPIVHYTAGTPRYYRAVTNRLRPAQTREQTIQALGEIRAELATEAFPC